jgi:hypothetical protein
MFLSYTSPESIPVRNDNVKGYCIFVLHVRGAIVHWQINRAESTKIRSL